MRKHYIIDGYNVINASPELMRLAESFGIERARKDFLNAVREFAERRGARCTIVFDGVANENDSRGLVRVVSTRRRSADDVIREQARVSGKDLVVVTSDLEIVATARTNLAVIVPSNRFVAELDLIPSTREATSDRRAAAPKRIEELRERSEKPGAISDDEIDEWKRLFGAD